MSDEGNKTEGQNNTGQEAGELGKQVQTLTTQLAEANKQLEAAQTKLKELEGQNGGLTTANKQLNEKLTGIEEQFKAAQGQLEAKTGEVTNLTTQLEQVNGNFGQTTADLTRTQQELNLYKTIAGDQKYHGLIGMVEGIKVVDDADTQKTILDAMAQAIQGQVDNTLNIFKAGGSPPAGTGGNAGPAGPKDVKEAHARLLQIAGVPGAEQEVAALQQFIQNAANGGNQQA